MLVVSKEEKKGMIGQIGKLIGESKVNIATMKVSQNQKNGIAMMLLNVDSDVEKKNIDILKGIEGITEVNMVKI